MRLTINHHRARGRGPAASSAFTMVEIALSLAVVSFALVAILGILPSGMTVQRDNREDTIINQEGRYWLEAIKNGALGSDDLTNYVEEIVFYLEYLDNRQQTLVLSNSVSKPWQGSDIIGMLTTPKYGNFSAYPHASRCTNRTVAIVKAITGSAAEKGPLTNEFSLRYELETELVANYPLPRAYPGTNLVVSNYNASVGQNLHDLRLILRWPVVRRGNEWVVGNNRKQFRGKLVGTPTAVRNDFLGATNWFIIPNVFIGSGGGAYVNP